MRKWVSSELHTHTLHSDGSQTLMELAEGAKKLGIDCVCITDHNTIAAHAEVEEVSKKTGIPIIKGMEWTTFYGHVLCMGINKYIDWRDLNEDNIKQGIQRVHRQNALIGVAHPFQDGSPLITGGSWKYKVSDWNDFDYMEVWHENFPAYQRENVRAYKLWNDILNGGNRITGVNGIDWHRIGEEERDIPVTYIGIDNINDDITKAVLTAIKNGSVTVTMGPLLLMTLSFDDGKYEYQIGDTVEKSNDLKYIKINISIDYSVRKQHWNLTDDEDYISLTSNLGELKKINVNTGIEHIFAEVPAEGLKWIKAELYGSIRNIDKIVAFTNPIYFK